MHILAMSVHSKWIPLYELAEASFVRSTEDLGAALIQNALGLAVEHLCFGLHGPNMCNPRAMRPFMEVLSLERLARRPNYILVLSLV